MAISYNVHSLTRTMAQALNDGKWASNSFTGFALMNEAEYARFIIRNLTSTEQSFVLQKQTTGSYAYEAGNRDIPYIWLANHSSPFTGQGTNTVYEVYCEGASIWVSTEASSVTVSSITLTGCTCNYREALAQCKEFIAANRALLFAQSFADGSMTPEQAAAYLRSDAAHTRGAYGS